MEQEFQSSWRSILEFFKKPSFRRLFFAVLGVIGILGAIEGLYYGVTRRNLFGDLFHVGAGLVHHTHLSTATWSILALASALLFTLMVAVMLFVLRHHALKRLRMIQSEAIEKETALANTIAALRASESDARLTVGRLDGVALTMQTTAEDMLAEEAVWRRVADSFLFSPHQFYERVARGQPYHEELAAIRHRFTTALTRLRKIQDFEPITEVAAYLLNDDKDLAKQVIQLIRSSITRQPGPVPEAATESDIERKTRERFLEALTTSGLNASLAETRSSVDDVFGRYIEIWRGRDEAAKRLSGKGQAVEALNDLLNLAMEASREAFGAERGLIFIPDPSGERLVRCAATQFNAVERTRPSSYYVGNRADMLTERGAAGYAYINKVPVACEWNDATGRYEDRYGASQAYPQHGRYSIHPPIHKSFIAIPLYGPLLRRPKMDSDEDAATVEGVLCWDARASNHYRNHFLTSLEGGYQRPEVTLIRVIYELVQWRRGLASHR